MKKPKLKTNYNHIQKDVLAAFTQDVVKQTTDGTYFDHGATRAAGVLAALTALNTATAETAHPTPSQNAAREGLRTTVRTTMGLLAAQCNIDVKALGFDDAAQEAALLSTGLELVESSGPNHRPIETAPTDVVFVDGTLPGWVLLKFKRPTGAVQTIVRYTTDAALPEANWLVAVGGGRERALGPFLPGTKVAAKVAALYGSTTEPDYSAVHTRLVQGS